ncbi:DJ-1/PfpI family protein [candidate division WOR-3 bacterium]|nr:DJ-1/PfpI family protein [candidate division WOR-3 bacterium]
MPEHTTILTGDSMSRIRLLVLMLLGAAAFCPAQPPSIPAGAGRDHAPGRTVLVFLPQQFYADEEFEPLNRSLEQAGFAVRVCAAGPDVVVSLNRQTLRPDVVLASVDPADYAGLVLIGGSGAALHWDDSLLHTRCRQFAESGKVVAAIGVAPIALAHAGVLRGRRATVFADRAAVGFLKQGGSRHSFRPLVVDRRVITAASAEHAAAFARAVVRALINTCAP